MTENQIVRSAGDALSEAVYVNCILISGPSLLKVSTFEDFGDWLLELLLVLVKVEVELKRAMAATKEPLEDPHELGGALKQCRVFIHQE